MTHDNWRNARVQIMAVNTFSDSCELVDFIEIFVFVNSSKVENFHKTVNNEPKKHAFSLFRRPAACRLQDGIAARF